MAGGPGEARTPDPLVANQVLSQLSYRPVKIAGKRYIEGEPRNRQGGGGLAVALVTALIGCPGKSGVKRLLWHRAAELLMYVLAAQDIRYSARLWFPSCPVIEMEHPSCFG